MVTGADDEEIMVGSRNAIIYRTSLAEIRTLGRIAQGVKIMTKLADDDVVISMSAFRERTWEDFESLPPVQPKKARAASTNGHASDAMLDDADADAPPGDEAADAVDDIPREAEDALETGDAEEQDEDPGEAEEDAVEDDAPSAAVEADEVPGATDEDAARVDEGTTLSMWHVMDAPLFPEQDEENGA